MNKRQAKKQHHKKHSHQIRKKVKSIPVKLHLTIDEAEDVLSSLIAFSNKDFLTNYKKACLSIAKKIRKSQEKALLKQWDLLKVNITYRESLACKFLVLLNEKGFQDVRIKSKRL